MKYKNSTGPDQITTGETDACFVISSTIYLCLFVSFSLFLFTFLLHIVNIFCSIFVYSLLYPGR